MKKRIAAEWEPTKGVLVTWPPAIPEALYRQLAKDTDLYVMVWEEENREEAEKVFAEWGFDMGKVHFLDVDHATDCYWPRDWGPQPLFDRDGTFKMLCPKYEYGTPACTRDEDDYTKLIVADGTAKLNEVDWYAVDNTIAQEIAADLDIPALKVPFAFTGGNVLTDGVDTLLSMKVIIMENEYDGLTPEKFHAEVLRETGMGHHIILDDYADFGIQHVDCFLKIISEDTVVALRPPKVHPLFPVYEHVVDQLSEAKNSFGKPYRILRIDTAPFNDKGELAAYANSLILNGSIYVPLFSIPQDRTALEQWSSALPGYIVHGFEFKLSEQPHFLNEYEIYENIGWTGEDVLHCRTRAIWDVDMLHIDVDELGERCPSNEPLTIKAHIVDYAGKGLEKDGLMIRYRIAGASRWSQVPFEPSGEEDGYKAVLPAMPKGATIEYYAEAATRDGRIERRPYPAPAGFFTSQSR